MVKLIRRRLVKASVFSISTCMNQFADNYEAKAYWLRIYNTINLINDIIMILLVRII
jgi:hypothetical protein